MAKSRHSRSSRRTRRRSSSRRRRGGMGAAINALAVPATLVALNNFMGKKGKVTKLIKIGGKRRKSRRKRRRKRRKSRRRRRR